jgi:hypothetical protein
VPPETHPVRACSPQNAKAADSPAIRRDLEDDEFHEPGFPEREHEHRLPVALRP